MMRGISTYGLLCMQRLMMLPQNKQAHNHI